MYNIQIILNKSLVKISKAKEDLDVFIRLRLRPFINSFNLCRVYYNTLRGNKIAKKLNKLGIKGVFGKFSI